MIDYFQKENQRLLDLAVGTKHENIGLAREKRSIKSDQAKVDGRYESLSKWVARKTKSKERREKLENDALTKYRPNHKEAIHRSNYYCRAEHRIKNDCRETLARIVEAVQEQSTEEDLIEAILEIERECQAMLAEIGTVPVPRGLQGFLE